MSVFNVISSNPLERSDLRLKTVLSTYGFGHRNKLWTKKSLEKIIDQKSGTFTFFFLKYEKCVSYLYMTQI